MIDLRAIVIVACVISGAVWADVTCPDHKSSCPDDTTCCKLKSGEWGCCPMPKAVCCSDGEHCCPTGTTCDLVHQTCVHSNGHVSGWHRKHAAATTTARPRPEPATTITCPDKRSKCPTGQTCCISASGGYDCCPVPHAVCCKDKLHCCPHATKCNLVNQTCVHGNGHVTRWQRKHAAVAVRQVECPDAETVCEDGQTCCLMTSGDYGCCPLPNAVCCDDKVHCCPQYTKCDATQQSCVTQRNGNVVSRWYEKTLASRKHNGNHQLPTSNHNQPAAKPKYQFCAVGAGSQRKIIRCADGTTCCGTGCCPFKNGVCCSDKKHCCPSTTSCATNLEACEFASAGVLVRWQLVEQGKVSQPDSSTSLGTVALTNQQAGQGEIEATGSSIAGAEILCEDSVHVCPSGSKCCPTKNGKFGCCKHEDGKCCGLRGTCCPSGWNCSSSNGKCVKDNVSKRFMQILKKSKP